MADTIEESLRASSDSIDAIVTNGPLQVETIELAANAGKHLLVESPIASSAQRADEMIANCDRYGVSLMTGQAMRFLPEVAAIKESLESGKLGEAGLLRIHHWGAARQSDIGRIVREIDLANWIFGRVPSEIYAAGTVSEFVQLHFGFGEAMAVIDFATTPSDKSGYFSMSVIGSTGAAYADDHRNMQVLFGGNQPAAITTSTGNLHRLAQLQEFVSAINEGRSPAITGADGRAAIQVAEASMESLSSGQAMRFVAGEYAQA
ncbi:MAG: Gfo/Idh/MocA family oxidoreductase [Planctomycetota bacterium]|nr:Gfo/Idh/MocA family oxidoreductase [Planctomycetota bacterium]